MPQEIASVLHLNRVRAFLYVHYVSSLCFLVKFVQWLLVQVDLIHLPCQALSMLQLDHVLW